MSPVQVPSVEYHGRLYQDCHLNIDEANKEFAVSETKRSLWRKEEALLFSIPYSEGTSVSRHGRFVQVDDMTIGARDEEDSARIASILGEPRQKAHERRHQARRDAEHSVGSFLKARAEALSFLETLKANPRGAFFSLAPLSKGSQDPLLDWRRGSSARLAKCLQDVDAAIGQVAELEGHETAERLYAITYLVGQAQNALAEGDPRRLEAYKPLAADLDVDRSIFGSLKAETVTERLLDAARINFMDEPAAAPPAKG